MPDNGYVQNFNLVNCYVDTSHYVTDAYGNGSIVTSKFSNEDAQVDRIERYFVIVANPGFKLKPEFSFKLQPQLSMTYDPNSQWVEITNENFTPITNELNLDIVIDDTYTDSQGNRHIVTSGYDFQINDADLSKSLVSETVINGVSFYIFLLGGFNEYKLVFRLYKQVTGNSDVNKIVNYGNVQIARRDFTYAVRDAYGSLKGYYSILNDLLFTAESEQDLEPDINNSFFTTYYVDISTLREIKQQGAVPEELIINTYSYPIKFNEEQLVESSIKTGYISTEVIAKIFKRNYTSLDIFKFTVPDISDATECYIKIPFNNDVNLNYEDIKGKTIRGYITYEVLTNTTTLFITDEEKILYKDIISIGVEIPYKPTGELRNFKDVQTRLAYEEPKLYIKGVGKSIKGNYLKGFMKAPNNILKDELNLLNNLLNEGVFINDEDN